jgi:hypothetical protein
MRSGETVGAPRRISARHSAYRNPGVEGAAGGLRSAPAVVVGRSSARWNVKIVIVGNDPMGAGAAHVRLKIAY